MNQATLHSVVIPVFNEREGLTTLTERLTELAQKLLPDATEFIFVNDGSSDGSNLRLEEIALHDSRFKVLHFSRNFGHQIAITAGIEWATGQTVTVIDADLQDPPEVIAELVSKWREGFDVVYGIRRKRDGETLFKLWTARLFYRLIRSLTQFDIPVDTGDFRLMDRKAVNALQSLPERRRFVRGMVSWIGFKQAGVSYDRHERKFGQTHYPLGKMIRLALDGITSFSTAPLQLATWMGVLVALMSMGMGLWALYIRLFTDQAVPGWTSVILAVLLIGAVQLLSLGMIGEYLGRTYEEVKRRPIYLISTAIGFERDQK